jgi:hypothetical protein
VKLTPTERRGLLILLNRRRQEEKQKADRARWEKAGGPKGGNLRYLRDKA